MTEQNRKTVLLIENSSALPGIGIGYVMQRRNIVARLRRNIVAKTKDRPDYLV
jgi:hypothetical protein